jgi:hypothetical protein
MNQLYDWLVSGLISVPLSSVFLEVSLYAIIISFKFNCLSFYQPSQVTSDDLLCPERELCRAVPEACAVGRMYLCTRVPCVYCGLSCPLAVLGNTPHTRAWWVNCLLRHRHVDSKLFLLESQRDNEHLFQFVFRLENHITLRGRQAELFVAEYVCPVPQSSLTCQ